MGRKCVNHNNIESLVDYMSCLCQFEVFTRLASFVFYILSAKSNSETLLADLRRKLELDGQDSSPSDCGPSQEILDEVVSGNVSIFP